MNDYENCEAYQIKKPAAGICIGDGEQCEACPAHIRYKEREAPDDEQGMARHAANRRDV